MLNKFRLTLLLAALALGGCSIAGDGLWPGTAEQAAEQAAAQTPSAPTGTERVTLGDWANPLSPGEPLVLDLPAPRDATASDSFVGKKVTALRSDLDFLVATLSGQNEEYGAIVGTTAQTVDRYDASINSVRTGLSAGAAPSDSGLVSQLQSASDGLDQIGGSKPRLTELSARVAANTGLAAYVGTSAKSAMDVDGAGEDDRQQLMQIVEDVAQVAAENDRLLSEVNASITRNDAGIAAERTNLSTLMAAVSRGTGSVESQPMAAAMISNGALIAIEFGRARFEYEQALYEAVSAALNQRPNARFELVAMMPQRAGSGKNMKQNTERVFRSLVEMGLPSERVILLSETDASLTDGEVQLYTR